METTNTNEKETESDQMEHAEENGFDEEDDDFDDEDKVDVWNGVVEHLLLPCAYCQQTSQFGRYHHSFRIPCTTTNPDGKIINEPGLYMLICPRCQKTNVVPTIELITKESADAIEKQQREKVPWMQFLLKLVKIPILWDRYTENKETREISVYGWIQKRHKYKGKRWDFVVIEFCNDVFVSIRTSSVKYSKTMAEAVGVSDHHDCIPFDHVAFEQLKTTQKEKFP